MKILGWKVSRWLSSGDLLLKPSYLTPSQAKPRHHHNRQPFMAHSFPFFPFPSLSFLSFECLPFPPYIITPPHRTPIHKFSLPFNNIIDSSVPFPSIAPHNIYTHSISFSFPYFFIFLYFLGTTWTVSDSSTFLSFSVTPPPATSTTDISSRISFPFLPPHTVIPHSFPPPLPLHVLPLQTSFTDYNPFPSLPFPSLHRL